MPKNQQICSLYFFQVNSFSSYLNKLEAKLKSMLGSPCISVNNSSNAPFILDALNLKTSDKIAYHYHLLASSSAIEEFKASMGRY